MSFQKCPACNGSGYSNEIGYPYPGPCSVCGGFKIINEATGKPPYKTVTSTKIKIDPFFDGLTSKTVGQIDDQD